MRAAQSFPKSRHNQNSRECLISRCHKIKLKTTNKTMVFGKKKTKQTADTNIFVMTIDVAYDMLGQFMTT